MKHELIKQRGDIWRPWMDCPPERIQPPISLGWRTPGQDSITIFCCHCGQLERFPQRDYNLIETVACRYLGKHMKIARLPGTIPNEVIAAARVHEREYLRRRLDQ